MILNLIKIFTTLHECYRDYQPINQLFVYAIKYIRLDRYIIYSIFIKKMIKIKHKVGLQLFKIDSRVCAIVIII